MAGLRPTCRHSAPRFDCAANTLAKGCSVDLHPRCSAPVPPCRRCGQAVVVLMPLSDNGSDYRILVLSSFARYLAEWLVDGAEEFGVDC